MKNLLITITMILLLCSIAKANDPNESLTFWLSGSNPFYENTDISVWIGYRADNSEFGVAGDWRMFSEGDNDEDVQSNFALGPYACYHIPGLIDLDNPFDGIGWMPEKIAGDPFIALSYLFDLKGKGTAVNPVVGIRLFDLFAIKYQYSFFNGSPAEDEDRFGISGQYRF